MIQTFRHGNVTATIYLGDSLLIAPTISGVDAVISDPPYGMDWDTDSTRFTGGTVKRGTGRDDYGQIKGDAVPFDPAPWTAYGKCVLFGSNHFASKLPVGTTLVWIKKDAHLWGSFLSDAETAWMKGGCGVYLFSKPFPPPARAIDAGNNHLIPTGIHPTQKPVSLMAWCMTRAKVPEGATVLDPYMGSGSTAIACLRTGRNFVGIEIDPAHYKTAAERIAREVSNPLLFP